MCKNRNDGKYSLTLPDDGRRIPKYPALPRLSTWRTLMRKFRTILGSVLASSLLALIVCQDSEACWRGRHRGHGPGCAPQFCIDCIDIGRDVYFPKCPTGQTCWCCESGTWVPCDDKCGTGPFACVKGSSPPSVSCGGYDGCPSVCHSGSSTLVCAMVCDPVFHVLRFPLPGECPYGYFSLCLLGAPCCPPAK